LVCFFEKSARRIRRFVFLFLQKSKSWRIRWLVSIRCVRIEVLADPLVCFFEKSARRIRRVRIEDVSCFLRSRLEGFVAFVSTYRSLGGFVGLFPEKSARWKDSFSRFVFLFLQKSKSWRIRWLVSIRCVRIEVLADPLVCFFEKSARRIRLVRIDDVSRFLRSRLEGFVKFVSTYRSLLVTEVA
jgi:hypothetical protein